MLGEAATREKAAEFWGALAGYLPNPDIVLGKENKRVTALRDLLTDARVWAAVNSRKSGVLSMEWEIDRGKSLSRAAKAAEKILESINLNTVIAGILDAVLYGYQPLEVVWGQGRTIASILTKPPEWFVFDMENRIRFLSKQSPMSGEEVDHRKILCATSQASYANPYGEAVLSRCYWPVAFKKGGFRFWLQFAERHGMPWVHGKLPAGRGEDDARRFANDLAAMMSNGVVVTPDDETVQFVATDTRASSELYKAIVDQANSEISAAILGHAGAGESTPGKLGGDDTGLSVRQEVVESDRRMVEEIINQVLAVWMEANAFGGEPPRFVLYQEEEVDLALAERDEKLSAVMAASELRLSRDYFRREYGLTDADMEDAAPAEVKTQTEQPEYQTQAFAERGSGQLPDQTAIDAATLPAAQAQSLFAPMVAEAAKVFSEAGGYQEGITALAERYPDMDTSALTELLSRAIFVAEAWGRISAAGESNA